MHRLARALLPGVLAAGPALLALLVLPPLLGGPGLLEAVADGVLRIVPLPVFEAVLGALGPLAKGTLSLAVVAGALVAGGALGALLGGAGPGDARGRVARAALAAGSALGLAELVVLPLTGAGLLGVGHAGPVAALHVPIAAAAVLFGATLAGLGPRRAAARQPGGPGGSQDAVPGVDAVRAGAPTFAVASPAAVVPSAPAPAPPEVSRRSVLAGGTALAALAALAASGVVATARIAGAAGIGLARPRRPPAPGGFGPTPAITPVGDLYVVAKDLAPPAVDAGAWRLAVDGLVGTPRHFSLDDMKALASQAGPRTLLCISNPVLSFGRYAGTQVWTGTTVAAVLDAAGGPLAGARFVRWTSADGYTESIALDVALDPRSLLAWGIGFDAAPLPPEHGFPLRVLLPGRYGMKQPKWLTRITLAADDAAGFWEQRGWDREAVIRTWSRIDDPLDGDVVAAGAPLPAYGVAFAGERGIRAVEVSGDGGATWVATEIEPPPTPLAWVRWRATLPAPAAGPLVLRVRAIDGTGALQAEAPEPTLPRGAAGWQEVRVLAS